MNIYLQTVLPCLKSDVHMKMNEVNEKLEALGRGIPDDEGERRQLLTDVSCLLFTVK